MLMTVLSKLAIANIGSVSPVRGSFEIYCWRGVTASGRTEIGIAGRCYKGRPGPVPGTSWPKAPSPTWRPGLTNRSGARHKRSSRVPGYADQDSITPITDWSCKRRVRGPIQSASDQGISSLSGRWGRSSDGRAPRSQCGGQEFDPPRLHQFVS